MNDVWINNDGGDALSERYGIEEEKIKCIVDLTGDALNSLSRGITTKEKLTKDYNQHISKTKTDTLINQIVIHQDYQRKTVMFSNVQDVFLNIAQIVQQNREILRLLQDLVNIRRKETKN